MIITNSLGSNYTAEDRTLALKLLLQPWKWQKGPEIKLLKSKIATSASWRTRNDINIELFLKGRHAVFEALRELGIGHNDEVIVQAFTCVAVVQPILDLGATPIYVDVAPKNLNPTLAQIKKSVTSKTRAIILQHTLGYINRENNKIVAWCQNHKIFIIQDLAHVFLPTPKPTTNNQQLITFADAIILSFSQDKIIDGVSGGGLVIVPRSGISLRETSALYVSQDNRGLLDRHAPIVSGLAMTSIMKLLLYPIITYLIRSTYNYKLGKIIHFCAKNLDLLPSPLDSPAKPAALPNTLASLALNQLKRLDEIISHRRDIALTYDRTLNQKFKLVTINDINHSSNLRYPIWVEDRDELEKKLTKYGYYLMDHWYDAPVSPSWVDNSEVKYRPGSCPNAEVLSKHIFNLPAHINITEKEAERLAKLVND
jgi:dTDP-4-amino-4,6-dideoxygalactose transaminase